VPALREIKQQHLSLVESIETNLRHARKGDTVACIEALAVDRDTPPGDMGVSASVRRQPVDLPIVSVKQSTIKKGILI
jgi:hypothetical protein